MKLNTMKDLDKFIEETLNPPVVDKPLIDRILDGQKEPEQARW